MKIIATNVSSLHLISENLKILFIRHEKAVQMFDINNCGNKVTKLSRQSD